MTVRLADPCARKRVVVCVDDFGLTDRGSEAAIELAAREAVSAVSCIVDGRTMTRYASALRAVSPPVSLGLHLNLTEPADGSIHAALRSWLLRAYVLHSIDAQMLRVEIQRQLARFEDLFAQPPDFVDGHEHVHQLSGIAAVLVDELAGRYGTRVAVRSTVPRQARGLKARVIAQLGGNELSELLRKRSMATNTDFAGVYDFSLRVPYARRMGEWINSIEDRGLIMCHPERAAPGATQPTARTMEHAFLASASWITLLRRSGTRLAPFGGSA